MAERKKHMFVVDFWEDIEKNFRTLTSYKTSSDKKLENFFQKLIISGICFLAFKKHNEVLFGPSRFIGYAENSFQSHKTSKIYGPETNDAIALLLGYPPQEDLEVNRLYEEYCSNNGIRYSDKGSFGKERKFWYRSDSKDELYFKFENYKHQFKKNNKIKIQFNESYDSWKFEILGSTNKITSGEIEIPLLNNEKVEVHGKMVSNLRAVFEFYPETRKYHIAINRHDLMSKRQKMIVERNVRIKLKEVLLPSKSITQR
ncbi:MAG: hypothetical protein IH852_17055 [Bacteroidetes bacterium]|nr:hypothetical protein [Bacteroidota bacterium]